MDIWNGRGRAMTRERAETDQRSYCLRCYSDLDWPSSARTVCPSCGFLNLRVDHRVYWTREPKLVEVEWSLKAAVIVVSGIVGFSLISTSTASGTGAGWFFAIPFVAAVAMWSSLSKITRHGSYFSAKVLWSAVFLLPVVGLLVVGICQVVGCLSSSTGWDELAGIELWVSLAVVGVLAALFSILGASVWVLMAWAERWKARKISGGRTFGVPLRLHLACRLLFLGGISLAVILGVGWGWTSKREREAFDEECLWWSSWMESTETQVDRVISVEPSLAWLRIQSWSPPDPYDPWAFRGFLARKSIDSIVCRKDYSDLRLATADLLVDMTEASGTTCPFPDSWELERNLCVGVSILLCDSVLGVRIEGRDPAAELSQLATALAWIGRLDLGAMQYARFLSVFRSEFNSVDPSLAYSTLAPLLDGVEPEEDLSEWIRGEATGLIRLPTASPDELGIVSFLRHPVDLARRRSVLSDLRGLSEPGGHTRLSEKLFDLQRHSRGVALFRSWRPTVSVGEYRWAVESDLGGSMVKLVLGVRAFRNDWGAWPSGVSDVAARLPNFLPLPCDDFAEFSFRRLQTEGIEILASHPAFRFKPDDDPSWPHRWVSSSSIDSDPGGG